MEEEVHKFSHLTAEMAFVIRVMFFFLSFSANGRPSGDVDWEVLWDERTIIAVVLALCVGYLP